MQSARSSVLAFGKQVALGTALANPTYALPVIGGAVKPGREMGELPTTGPTLARRGLYVVRAMGGGGVQVLAHEAPTGLLVFEVMGTQAISGAGPYLHTFTLADPFPIPMTVWMGVGDLWWRFVDCFVGRLGIQGASGDNYVLSPEFVSLGLPRRVAAPTYTLIDEEPRFKYIGSQIKLEADVATPVLVDNAEAVELVIDRAPTVRYGTGLGPNRIVPTARAVDFSATVTQDESGNNQGWDFLAAAFLGSAAATGDVSQNLERGSFDVKSGRHPADASRFLQFASQGDVWEYGVESPDPDASGEPITLGPAGPLKHAGALSELTVTLQNDVAAIY